MAHFAGNWNCVAVHAINSIITYFIDEYAVISHYLFSQLSSSWVENDALAYLIVYYNS